MGKIDQLYMDTQEHLSELLNRPATEQEVNDYVAYNTLLLSNAPVSAALANGPSHALETLSRDYATSSAPGSVSADWRPAVGSKVYCKDDGTESEIEHHCNDGDILVYGPLITGGNAYSYSYDQDEFNYHFSLTPPIPVKPTASEQAIAVAINTYWGGCANLRPLVSHVNQQIANYYSTAFFKPTHKIISDYYLRDLEALQPVVDEVTAKVKLDPICCGEPAELKTFDTFSYHYCNLCKQEVKS